MYADLHIHTNYSDGIYSPKEIIEKAINARLQKIAITDHDNFLGSIEAQKILDYNGSNLELIPGIEFSCHDSGSEFHIIGLFIDFNTSNLSNLVSKMQNERMKSIKKIINHLRSKNIIIDFDKVISRAKGSVGRPHIALELIEKGFATNVNDAFDKYLSNNILGKIKEPRMSTIEAIEAIRESRGLPIWAHPKLSNDLLINIKKLKNQGLMGVEIQSPRYSLSRQSELINICKKHELIFSGGSDFHGVHEGIEISRNNAITEEEYILLDKAKKDLC